MFLLLGFPFCTRLCHILLFIYNEYCSYKIPLSPLRPWLVAFFLHCCLLHDIQMLPRGHSLNSQLCLWAPRSALILFYSSVFSKIAKFLNTQKVDFPAHTEHLLASVQNLFAGQEQKCRCREWTGRQVVGEGEGGMNWGVGLDIYTPPCAK